MDLALNNLQRLICHKTQTTNNQQPKCGLEILYSHFCESVKLGIGFAENHFDFSNNVLNFQSDTIEE